MRQFGIIFLILHMTHGSILFELEPKISYIYRGDPLVVICNASKVSNSTNWLLLYESKGENFTINKIKVTNGYVKGVISNTQKLSRIDVVCINNDQKEFGFGQYVFIDKITQIMKRMGQPKVLCQYFGAQLGCCVTVSSERLISEMKLFRSRDLQFNFTVESQKLPLTIFTPSQLLIYGMDLPSRFKVNTTCFMGQILIVPFIRTNLSITAALEDNKYEMKFPVINKMKISRPPKPEVTLYSNNVVLRVDLYFTSLYKVNMTCVSNYPTVKYVTQEVETTRKYQFDFSKNGWKPYALIICKAFSILKYDQKVTSLSMITEIQFRVYESVPSKGPNIILRKWNSMFEVYIMDIPPIDRNGKIIKYKIKCTLCSNDDLYVGPYERKLKLNLSDDSTVSVAGCTKKGCKLNEVNVNQTFNRKFEKSAGLVKVADSIFWWFTSKNDNISTQQIYNQSHISILECALVTNKPVTCKTIKQHPLNPRNNNTFEKFELPPSESPNSMLSYSLAMDNLLITDWSYCPYKASKPIEGFRTILNKTGAIKTNIEYGWLNWYLEVEFYRPSCRKFSLFYITELLVKINNQQIKIPLRDQSTNKTKIKCSFYEFSGSITVYVEGLENSKYTLYQTKDFKRFPKLLVLLLGVIILITLFIVLLIKRLLKWRKKTLSKPQFNFQKCKPPRTLNENSQHNFEEYAAIDLNGFEKQNKSSPEKDYSTIDSIDDSTSPVQNRTSETTFSSNQPSSSDSSLSNDEATATNRQGYLPRPDYCFIGEHKTKNGTADLLILQSSPMDV